MNDKPIDVYLAMISFFQLAFLGFAGSLVSELIKTSPEEVILFWSSLFSLILGIVVTYLYTEAFHKTKS